MQLYSAAAIDSPSHLTLQHANSARGTRVPPTTSASLQFGLNVAGSSRAQTC
jgi:hypothetical protein